MHRGNAPQARCGATRVARARRGPRQARVEPARACRPATAALPRADHPLPSPRRTRRRITSKLPAGMRQREVLSSERFISGAANPPHDSCDFRTRGASARCLCKLTADGRTRQPDRARRLMARTGPSARRPAGAAHRRQGRAPRRLTRRCRKSGYPIVQRVSFAPIDRGLDGACVRKSGGSPRCESPSQPSKIEPSDPGLEHEPITQGGKGHENDYAHAVVATRRSRCRSAQPARAALRCHSGAAHTVVA